MEVAGFAFGAISLGLEVTKITIAFADAIRSHTDDLDALGQQAKALERNLELLSSVLAKLGTPPTQQNAPTATFQQSEGHAAITQSLKACLPDLQALKDFVEKYSDGRKPTDSQFKAVCRESFRKLRYGFKGEKRAELEMRLASCNATLGVALQAQGLDMLIDTTVPLRGLGENFELLKTIATSQDRSLCAVQASTVEILSELHKLKAHNGEDTTQMQRSTVTTLSTDQRTTKGGSIGLDCGTGANLEDPEIRAARSRHEVQSEFMRVMLARTAHLDPGDLQGRSLTMAESMLSRPSLLRDVLDERTRTHAPPQSSQVTLQKIVRCECRVYRRKRNWTTSTPVASFSTETEQAFQHRPSCSFFKSSFAKRNTRKAVSVDVRLLGVAIKISLNISSMSQKGAGGWSLSPCISYYVMVDERSAAVFKHIDIMCAATLRFSNPILRSNDKDVGLDSLLKVLEHGWWCVRKAYDTGAISSSAVNAYGLSPMQPLLDLVAYLYESGGDQSCLSLVRYMGTEMLGFYQVPMIPNTPTSWRGYNPTRTESRMAAVRELQEMIPRGAELLPDRFPFLRMDNFFFYLSRDPSLIEQFDVSPLASAIIQGRGEVVLQIVRDDVMEVLERSDFNLPTYLHLALSIGRCVEEILEPVRAMQSHTLPDFVSNFLMQAESRADTSLVKYTLRVCDRNNSFSGKPMEKPCRWSLALFCILQADAIMEPATDVVQGVCYDCIMVYVTEMKRRRKALQMLAISKLSPIRSERWSLNTDHILDKHSEEVIQQLQKEGNNVPRSLLTAITHAGTIYHTDLKLPRVAEAYQSAGFHDIDVVDSIGFTPIMRCILKGRHLLAKWFADHGANLQQPCLFPLPAGFLKHPCSGLTTRARVAHLLCHSFAYSMNFSYDEDQFRFATQYAPAVAKFGLFSLRLSDGNTCQCLPGGWTPFIYFLSRQVEEADPRHRWAEAEYGRLEPPRNSKLYRYLVDLLPHLEPFIGPEEYQATLRYITFEALLLEHLKVESTDDDTKTQEQDEDTWTAFEKIVSEVGEVMHRLMPGTSGKEQGEENPGEHSSVVLTNTQSKGSTVHWTTIWIDYWDDCVNSELDRLYKADVAAGKRERAEDLGVIWSSRKPPPIRKTAPVVYELEYRDVEYYITRLDEV